MHSQSMAAMYDAAERPNDGLAVLRLVADRSIDEDMRISMALNFKKHLKERWSPAPVSETNPIPLNPISDVEKENIKTLVLSMMIKSSSKVQSQLIEVVSVIGHHDFPGKWPTLLPEIVANLNKFSRTNDYAAINLLLATANSLFMKFRYGCKTTDLLLDLKYCLDIFAKPLLEVFKRTATLIDPLVASGFVKKGEKKVASGAVNAAILNPYIESQRLSCSIFYSLNFQELPEIFKDQMCAWMVKFKKYLTLKYLAQDEFGVDVHLLDELQAAVCENISLYVEEELFEDYLSGFVEAILNLLVSSSSHGNGREHLIVTAIKFLITVSKSRHHTLLSRYDILKHICVSIVIPNVMLQDEEKKLLEMDPIEYIKRDMEGSDIDTRRGIACELLKGIAMVYKDEVTEKIRYLIDYCWNLYALNTKGNWKYMDCANRLVVSLATKNADETYVSVDLVDIDLFFALFVVREMDMWDAKSFPMMKAGVLKFLTLLRNQISKHPVLSVLPVLSRLLTSPDHVVHSYAAICIEKLLLVKDDGARTRYTADDISPILPTLMRDLFHVLSDPEFKENQYVMKCIMRVVCVGDLTADITSLCIEGLTTILHEVCQNPKDSIFNHYLFESLATLIRRVSVRSKNKIGQLLKKIYLVSKLEKNLFPGLEMIWARNIIEFFPYALLLLAEVADLNIPLLTKYYTHIFDTFRLPDTWTRSAKFPETETDSLKWPAPPKLKLSVLGIYNKLVSSSATEDHGFYVLNTVVENLGFEVISPFVRNVWISLFNRLQNKSRLKRAKNIILFMSLFLVKDGPRNLVDSVKAGQANALQAILEQFWIPNLELITCPIELKLTSIASTRLICESPDILDIMLWGKMLDGIMTLLSRREDDDEPEIPEIGETMGTDNASTFARIYNAEDPLKEIKDPRQYLVESLSNLFAASPQGNKYYHQAISESLEEANQSALLQLFNSFNVSFF